MSRRTFVAAGALGAAAVAWEEALAGAAPRSLAGSRRPPVAISTWKHGAAASRTALERLAGGGSPLDAVEKGINAVETDPRVDSVGVGGLPNEAGVVELDAAIMDGRLRCGSVMGLQGIATPISVARRVMERTRHVQLVGEGARRFALEQGFKPTELLTREARERWEEWRKSADRPVPGQVDRPRKDAPAGGAAKTEERKSAHDTVATLVLDARGEMCAGCSTSGLAWKMPGRVGDSPIVGAGLYCDGEVGAAGATGIGEEIVRVAGSFLIVEGMRRGQSPAEAIEEALQRILRADPKNRERQVAFIALARDGRFAAGAIQGGFQAAVAGPEGETLLDVPAYAG